MAGEREQHEPTSRFPPSSEIEDLPQDDDLFFSPRHPEGSVMRAVWRWLKRLGRREPTGS
jgi:hypothetical protein